jgi:cysteinyl-tRNA synthetase
VDQMDQGEGVEGADRKEDPLDFALWKAEKEGEDTAWDSPWGRGRPGWHIECSAMAEQLLGLDFDIHGGGVDLVFPHHENEVAQSRCCFGTEVMANDWLHNGFLQVEGDKMSKSLGNFVTINELLATDAFGGRPWPGEVLRLAMLRTHYRQPIDWTVRAVEEAEQTLEAWTARPEFMDAGAGELTGEVADALLDDLNTPKAIAELHALDRKGEHRALAANLRALGFTTPVVQQVALAPDVVARVEPLIAARKAARADKNWAESDRIRDELLALGVALKDNKDGTTTWEAAR